LAQTLVIGNETFKRRNIVGVWLGLPLITLGIYGFVWIYKVNDEARRYLRDDSIRPGRSVLAFIPGFILIVPPFIAIYRLGKRIARMEEAAGLRSRVEPVLGLVLSLIYGAYTLYYQSHLNGIWDRYLQTTPAVPPQPIAPPPPQMAPTLQPIAPPPPQITPPSAQNVPPTAPPG
jgi:Domain of unknown function (DUF4234)